MKKAHLLTLAFCLTASFTLAQQDQSADAWVDNGPNIVTPLSFGGRVGIGTQSPKALLDVRGNAVFKGDVYADIKIGQFNYGEMVIGTQTNTMLGFVASKGDMAFGTNLENNDHSTKLYIHRDGRVGIGTDKPAEKLDVNGSAIFESVDPAEVRIGQRNQGEMRIGTVNNSMTGYMASKGAIRFGTNLANNDQSTKLWIGIDGNIAIGDTVANEKLDVRGSGVFQSSGYTEVRIGQTGYGQMKIGTVQNTESGFVASNGTMTFGTNLSNNDQTAKLWIGRNGNICIGDTTATEKLEVRGTMVTEGFRMPTNAAAGKVLVSDANGNGTWQNPTTGNGPQANQRQMQEEIEQLREIVGFLAKTVEDMQQSRHTNTMTTTNLQQNYPNPFIGSTNINYTLQQAGQVSLGVFNLEGEQLESLVDSYLPAGEYTQQWNSNSEAAGVYLYKLTVDGQEQTKRMILAK